MKAPSSKQEVEYYMIATLIINPELIGRLSLKEEHFYGKNNLLAFQVLSEMNRRGDGISTVTFYSRFVDAGGDYHQIEALLSPENFYSPIFAETYLRILADELVKRKIREKYNDLLEAPKEFVEEVKKIELDFITESRPKNIQELFGEYSASYKLRKEKLKSGGAVGVITGFKKIDENCAFEQGGLIILAAKTSVGKTALALNIAINAAMFNQRVLFFTAEMQVGELMHRVLAQLTGVSSTRFKYANADHSMAIAINEVEAIKDKISFIDASKITSSDICRIVEKEANVDLVVIDYIQYLQDKVEKGQTNNDRIGQITRNLKAAAIGSNCAVLALSQVNRATTDIPQLHNLRDSGNIEQDSDIVLILHRENKEDVVAQFVVAKNRNGTVMQTELKFDPNLTKFYE